MVIVIIVVVVLILLAVFYYIAKRNGIIASRNRVDELAVGGGDRDNRWRGAGCLFAGVACWFRVG